MPDPYVEFFLNSKSDIVQYATLSISHSNFSKTHRVVKNNANGLTATLEEITVENLFDLNAPGHHDDYYVNNVYGDLFANAAHTATDFIEVEPDTSYYFHEYNRMAWYDANENFIFGKFVGDIEDSEILESPSNAKYVRISVQAADRTSERWTGLMLTKGTRPVDFVAAGAPVVIAEEVTFDYYPIGITENETQEDLDYTLEIEFGDLGEILPTELDLVAANDGFFEKPSIIYRSYRSDNLSAPMFGPIDLEITEFAFSKEGVIFTANAPRINMHKTGEKYTLSRFPMLRAFLDDRR